MFARARVCVRMYERERLRERGKRVAREKEMEGGMQKGRKSLFIKTPEAY